MQSLIYHTPENLTAVSPFDREITRIVKNKSVKIACPYISIGYLKRLTKLSSDWRLLTDIKEWMFSSHSEAGRAASFIEKYQNKIRHYKNLHAKIIITNSE